MVNNQSHPAKTDAPKATSKACVANSGRCLATVIVLEAIQQQFRLLGAPLRLTKSDWI